MSEELIIPVSKLNAYVGALLNADSLLHALSVEGEISGFKRHTSGHLYFSLKDETALVRCVMFRQDAMRLAFRPQDGQRVVVSGSAALYERDGSFQIYARSMREMGAGALYQRFLELKERLERQGLFDSAHKKEIPLLPRCVGVVTSGTGAALQDILQIIGRRFPKMNVCLCPVRVQGDGAAGEIARAIRRMNEDGRADVLIVGRGGGSIEDLWAFNEPVVAEAIYESAIPVISAVGHETDFTIADFTADLRAPTPSAAAELAVPEYAAYADALHGDRLRLSNVLQNDLRRRRTQLALLRRSHGMLAVSLRLSAERQRLDLSAEALQRALSDQIRQKRQALLQADGRLAALSPDAVLLRGFALVYGKDGHIAASADQLHREDGIRIRMADGTASAVVTEVERKVTRDG